MSFRQSKSFLLEMETVLRSLESQLQTEEEDPVERPPRGDPGGRTPSGRAGLVARSVAEHLQQARDVLRMLEERASEATLDSWLQYEPERGALDHERAAGEEPVDQALRVLAECEGRFVHLHERSQAPRVRELFQQLAELCRSNLERLSRTVQEARDL